MNCCQIKHFLDQLLTLQPLIKTEDLLVKNQYKSHVKYPMCLELQQIMWSPLHLQREKDGWLA